MTAKSSNRTWRGSTSAWTNCIVRCESMESTACDQVALAVLEVDGSISCLKYDEIKPDASTHLVRRRFIQKKQ